MKWTNALLLTLLACKGQEITNPGQPVDSPPPPPPVQAPADPWVVGMVTDSLTPASRLYQSPWWKFFILIVGADARRSGVANQGSIGRMERQRFAYCLGPSGQIPGERQLAYVALGDTMYAQDSAAYWGLVNRLAQGHDSLRIVLDSALDGQMRSRIPGLVVLTTGLFDPTVTAYGRGATESTAILRRWIWTDAGRTFAEDTSRAALAACNLK